MNLNLTQIITLAVGAILVLVVVWFVDSMLEGSPRTLFRWLAAIAVPSAAFYTVGKYFPDLQQRIGVSKALIGIATIGCLLYERQRSQNKQPISERWKKFIGVTLGVAAIVAYFNGFDWGYKKYYHRWDQYHYYMGAKYFKELGYDGLYKCSVIAQDEIGTFTWVNEDTGKTHKENFRAEARAPDKKIRNLSGDNLLIPVDDLLANPEQCRGRFTPERWEKYKADVKHFRLSCYDGKQYWEDMQRDHGYNPPPVWTLTGKFWAELHPATTKYLQFLGVLDVLYVLAAFAGLWWAFGWRVASIGAVFWGIQASAPSFWTLGAFLRQDWFFWFVMAACFMRKKYFALAGGSLVYSALLRVFPGLAIVGWLTVAGVHLYRHKNLARHHWRVLIGGTLAGAILIGASLMVAGTNSYSKFYHHTLRVHDTTPLTNHMGLRVMISHNFIGTDWHSGRMKYTKDMKLTDPFEVWKNMRTERYKKYKYVGYALSAGTFFLLLYVHLRSKNLWVAQCLGQIWIILGSQLTCYYYSFMVLLAPLTKLKRELEIPIIAFGLLTQPAHGLFWNDDKYALLTWISLLMCYAMIAVFLPKSFWARLGIRSRTDPAPGTPGIAR